MPKARSRSREVVTLDEAPRLSQRASSKIPSSASSSLTRFIGMPVYNGGFLVDTVKADNGGAEAESTGPGTAPGGMLENSEGLPPLPTAPAPKPLIMSLQAGPLAAEERCQQRCG